MNESEANPISNTPTNSDTDRIAALERQISTLLLALVILSGTFTVYLYRQLSIVSSDLQMLKPGAMQLIEAVKREKPGMDQFVLKLVEYGKTHPDFKPIVDKYGLNSPAVVAPPAASATTTIPQVPASTPVKKQ